MSTTVNRTTIFLLGYKKSGLNSEKIGREKGVGRLLRARITVIPEERRDMNRKWNLKKRSTTKTR